MDPAWCYRGGWIGNLPHPKNVFLCHIFFQLNVCVRVCMYLSVCVSPESTAVAEFRQEVELSLAGCHFFCLLRMEISGSDFSSFLLNCRILGTSISLFYFGKTNNRLRFRSKWTFFNALLVISVFLYSPLSSSRLSSNNFSCAFWPSLTCRSTSTGVFCNLHTDHHSTKLTSMYQSAHQLFQGASIQTNEGFSYFPYNYFPLYTLSLSQSLDYFFSNHVFGLLSKLDFFCFVFIRNFLVLVFLYAYLCCQSLTFEHGGFPTCLYVDVMLCHTVTALTKRASVAWYTGSAHIFFRHCVYLFPTTWKFGDARGDDSRRDITYQTVALAGRFNVP